jgi:glycosyltransferase involved in cell wall biosynthesis
MLLDLEERVNAVPFAGIPLGGTLNANLVIELFNRQSTWRDRARWLNGARRWRCLARAPWRGARVGLPAGAGRRRFLVTCSYDNFRYTDLMFPVVKELEPARCVVLGARTDVLARLPGGAVGVGWGEGMGFDLGEWRRTYVSWWPACWRALCGACRVHDLPGWVAYRLGFVVTLASQYVTGCLALLRQVQPAAVLTEADRLPFWSCLVLAARQLAIPSSTLVHGVLNDQAVGYVPLLADQVLCWGEVDRGRFLAAGVDPQRVLLGGCPRLSRSVLADRSGAKAKLGLPPGRPAVMLGSAGGDVGLCRRLAEVFIAGVRSLRELAAFVRLHPCESLAVYGEVARQCPDIRFSPNSEASLDEALAAADVVVVANSGVGSDALFKGRPVIVLHLEGALAGNALELVNRGECPVAHSAEQLAEALGKLLREPEELARRVAAAARYADLLCRYSGVESAQRIAAVLERQAADRGRLAGGRVSEPGARR